MLWLVVAIAGYFFLSIATLGDKYILTSRLNAKTYTFYDGVLGIFVLLLIPFVKFSFPDYPTIIFCFATGLFFVLGSYVFYVGLEKYEVSRIVTAVGGLLPIFTFFFSYFFLEKGKFFLSAKDVLAFFLLISGAFIIARVPGSKVFSRSLFISTLTSLLFAVYFVFSKRIYTVLPFWNAVILIRIGAFVPALIFIFSADVRKSFSFNKQETLNKKVIFLLFINQLFSASGALLQNWAIALASFSYIAFINALDGVRYVFLFIFTYIISWKFPQILKEDVSRNKTFSKIIAIFLIVGGLAILAL